VHPDLEAEQAYFDHALEQRELALSQLGRSPELAADPKSAVQLRERLKAVDVDPDEAVAFGRIDDGEARWYIGKSAIWDHRDADEVLVVNWQAPVAARFYTATPADPQGLVARRTYKCRANRILDIDELVFAAAAEAVAEDAGLDAPVLDDALLASLAEARSGELADIVATIQAAQYEVISRPMEQLLVVQGAPGTGKTVVGLHRVSWLLFNMRESLRPDDVLIVGPNPAFVRYISTVLPALGDGAVVQQPITALGPRVRQGRRDDDRVRRLKGDLRMDELLRRALRRRERIEPGPVTLTVGGRRVTIDAAELEARAAQLPHAPHNVVYEVLRDHLIRLVEAELRRAGVRDLAAFDISARGPDAREVDNYLDRVWPNLTPQAFLLDLLSTRRQLEAAAEGLLSPEEVEMLAIPRDARLGSWEWSPDDMPLLDAADHLLNGTRRDYAYVVVDEAQDLSPMQLLSIRRRSRTGWMTVLGDLAQGTSPWAHERWDDIARLLGRQGVPAHLDELHHAYRLPAEVHEVAMRLLPAIGPGLARPSPVRWTGRPVTVRTSTPDALVRDVVATARDLLGTGLIGIVVPDALRREVGHELDVQDLAWSPELRARAAPIVVLTPEEAKGLEFDNVVVVEPARIVAEHARGLPALFVALTRCTRHLALVHAAPLPAQLGLAPTAPPPPVAAEPGEREGAAPAADHPPAAAGSAPGPDGSAPDDAPAADAGAGAGADGAGADGADGAAGTEGAGRDGADGTRRDGADGADGDREGDGGGRGGNGVVAGPAAPDDGPVPVAVADAGALVSSGAVEREVARAVAASLVRYLTLCVQPELVPLVIEEMQRWRAPAPAEEPA
jgi:DNA helicase IV